MTGLVKSQAKAETMADFSRVFTLEVDGRPTLSFEASRVREAQEICKESWLRNDLTALRSSGGSVQAINTAGNRRRGNHFRTGFGGCETVR